jgi:hypothetical protein
MSDRHCSSKILFRMIKGSDVQISYLVVCTIENTGNDDPEVFSVSSGRISRCGLSVKTFPPPAPDFRLKPQKVHVVLFAPAERSKKRCLPGVFTGAWPPPYATFTS